MHFRMNEICNIGGKMTFFMWISACHEKIRSYENLETGNRDRDQTLLVKLKGGVDKSFTAIPILVLTTHFIAMCDKERRY